MSDGRLPNDWRISRRRVKQRAHQAKTRHITKTGNNKILDQAVRCMRGLGVPIRRCHILAHHSIQPELVELVPAHSHHYSRRFPAVVNPLQ